MKEYKFLPMYWKCLIVAMSAVLALVSMSGCKTLFESSKDKKENKADTTSVKKETEVKASGDTTKTEKTSTKETVYFPQPIIVPGKDGETKVIFVPQTVKETGTEKVDNGMFDNWRRNFEDSLRYTASQREKQTETVAKAETDPVFIIALAFFALILLAIVFMLYKLSNKFNLLNIQNSNK